MTQMVGCHLDVNPVLCRLVAKRHDARIVHEDIQPARAAMLLQGLSRLMDAGERGQIARDIDGHRCRAQLGQILELVEG